MQNILYIGPYKENNGLGRSSRRYLKSLSLHKNINLSCRPIYFTNQIQLEGGETDFIQPYEIKNQQQFAIDFELTKWMTTCDHRWQHNLSPLLHHPTN